MNETKPKSRKTAFKLIVLGSVLLIFGVCYFVFRDFLNQHVLQYLVSIETDLRDFKQDNFIVTLLLAFAIYVTVTSLSLPFASILSLAYAWFFGFFESVVLVSFASTTGATLAFLMSRYLFRDSVQQTFGERFDKLNRSFETEGAFYLFTLRLIPAFPFFLVNILMALTKIKTGTFWWVSQIGMLPGTAAYCFLGSQFSSLKSIADEGIKLNPWLFVAFITLGLFPLIVRIVIKRIKPVSKHADTNETVRP